MGQNANPTWRRLFNLLSFIGFLIFGILQYNRERRDDYRSGGRGGGNSGYDRGMDRYGDREYRKRDRSRDRDDRDRRR